MVREEVERVHYTLGKVDPSYKPRKGLREQDESFRTRFVWGFRQLRKVGILPSTTGNSTFNHQGMLLLMEQCFTGDDLLVQYLKDPSRLKVTGPRLREHLKTGRDERLVAELLLSATDESPTRNGSESSHLAREVLSWVYSLGPLFPG